MKLLTDFSQRVGAIWRLTHEAPIPIQGDRRAWDLLIAGPVTVGVEAETRPSDLQALERAIHLKQRDSGTKRVVLLIRGSRRNRQLIRELLPVLRPSFPLGTAEVMRALQDGRDPGADGLVVL